MTTGSVFHKKDLMNLKPVCSGFELHKENQSLYNDWEVVKE